MIAGLLLFVLGAALVQPGVASAGHRRQAQAMSKRASETIVHEELISPRSGYCIIVFATHGTRRNTCGTR
jgi:hypothetical protein